MPTPALYFALHHLTCDAGIQVTGSHNPPEFNGFKMVIGGESIHGDEILELYEMIVKEEWRSGSGRETADGSVLPAYREAIVARHTLARPVKVVADCGNGVASLIAISTLEALGALVTPLFAESDGTFPNHHPDPTVPENLVDLQRTVRTGAELGIAFDGDGDRIGAVDERGTIIWGDQLLIIFGRDAVRRFGPGVPVIFDVKCSELLPQALRRRGRRRCGRPGIPHRSPDEGDQLAAGRGDERPHLLRRRLVRVRRRALRRGAPARNRERGPPVWPGCWPICRRPSRPRNPDRVPRRDQFGRWSAPRPTSPRATR